MHLLALLILAVVQGITEFLPISSDGHLTLAGSVLEWMSGHHLPTSNLTVTILLHIGTLLAVLVVYRRELWRLLSADRRVIGLFFAIWCIGVGIIALAWHPWSALTPKTPVAAPTAVTAQRQ